MAINLKPKNASLVKSRTMGILLALGVIIFVSVITAIGSIETRKTIKVVRIKSDSISANALITEDMIEPYNMYYKEFQQYGTMKFSDGKTRSTIVRWSDKDAVVGKRYAAYYIRGNTILFWDSTLGEQTKKNSYLYSMSGELLNISLTTTADFGDMVVPGDTLNVRATYTETSYDLPTSQAYQLSQTAGQGSSEGVEVKKNELMFSEVHILDMLNSEGASIFDIYYSYISKTKEEQQALLKSEEFINSVKPSSILLECTSEEVERYMDMQSKGATYKLTLLPRSSSSSITDSLADIQEALSGTSNKSNSNK
jgi:hypothetical protein